MALVIPTGFAQVSIQFRNAGDPDPWYVTFAVEHPVDFGDYDLIADKVADAWIANHLGSMNTTTTMTGVQLRVGVGGDVPLTLFFPSAANGGSSTQKLPQNCALLVTKVTNRPGRTGKGRYFIPNILTESSVDQVGVITSGDVTDFQNNATGFLEDLAAAGDSFPCPMVLLHNAGAPGGTTPTPVDALVVDNVISTQRRRLR